MHLYLDWHWDTQVLEPFIQKTGDDWFAQYRREVSRLGSHLYHSSPWAPSIWQRMVTQNIANYDETPGVSAADVHDYLQKRHLWHCENLLPPSEIFTPSYIEKYTDDLTKEYQFESFLGGNTSLAFSKRL